MDAGSRAPKVGALGDAGAIAGNAGMRVLNKKLIGIGINAYF